MHYLWTPLSLHLSVLYREVFLFSGGVDTHTWHMHTCMYRVWHNTLAYVHTYIHTLMHPLMRPAHTNSPYLTVQCKLYTIYTCYYNYIYIRSSILVPLTVPSKYNMLTEQAGAIGMGTDRQLQEKTAFISDPRCISNNLNGHSPTHMHIS